MRTRGRLKITVVRSSTYVFVIELPVTLPKNDSSLLLQYDANRFGLLNTSNSETNEVSLFKTHLSLKRPLISEAPMDGAEFTICDFEETTNAYINVNTI